MEHVDIVVDDLAAATTFFVELGLKLQGPSPAWKAEAEKRCFWYPRPAILGGRCRRAATDANDLEETC
jgi:catechol 2,3-dioxygenase-like lactoylglutathione lyase family enzyme